MHDHDEKNVNLEQDLSRAEGYERILRQATSNITRVEMLMKRHSAKKWSQKKLMKMVRRAQAASEVGDNAYNMLEHVKQRLESHE